MVVVKPGSILGLRAAGEAGSTTLLPTDASAQWRRDLMRAWPSCASQRRATVPLLIGDLKHAHAAPDLYFQMDRANAIRLLKALAAAGMDTRTPRAE